MRLILRGVIGFFRFWYDFIVGDAWEIAAGIALVLFASILALRSHVLADSSVSYFVGAVVVLLVAASVVWEFRKKAQAR